MTAAMVGSTCLQCGAPVAGFREQISASKCRLRATDLSRSLVNLHGKGPPVRCTLSRPFTVTECGSGRRELLEGRGFSSVRCQAAAAAPALVHEKVHRSLSSESSDGPASLLPYSVLLEQGPREEMEDEAVVLNAHNDYVYAGVYDGHAGSAAVAYLRDHLHIACIEATASDNGAALETLETARAALEEAFVSTDAALLKNLSTIGGTEGRSGSTGTVALVRKDKAVVAYVGDSRAVLCRGKSAVDLSGDHRPYGKTPSAQAELKRLKEAGCWVNHGRVCSVLAVSRAFGDPLYKNDRNVMLEEGLKKGRFVKKFVDRVDLSHEWITARPDVTHTALKPEDQFLLLASDGLWDAIKSQAAVQFVLEQLEKKDDLTVATQELAKFALRERGSDNISIVLIDLRART